MTKKTPTLAQLRKLAKRKGLRIADKGFGPDDVVLSDRTERAGLFKYLSALPDSKRPIGGHHG